VKKKIGWVLSIVGVLLTGAFFIGGMVLFFTSSCESGEGQSGGQAFGFLIALIGIPFYFLAKLGWRLNGKQSVNRPISLSQMVGVEKKPVFALEEWVLTVIRVIGDRALFFTTNRIIVANTYEDAPIWTLPFNMLPSYNSSRDKLGKIKKMNPEQILMNDTSNYAISYSGLQSVRFYKKFIGQKIEIVTDTKAIDFHPKSLPHVYRETANRYEFWIYLPWMWKKYETALANILQEKLKYS
jgi:hypothetical protein